MHDHNLRHEVEQASLYKLLAEFYHYTNPQLHIHFYQMYLHHATNVANLYGMGMRIQLPVKPKRESKIRVLHASPDAPAVDVYANERLIFKGLTYKEITDYVTVPSGRYKIDIYPTGEKGNPVISQMIRAEPGKNYTVAATGALAQIGLTTFQDRLSLTPGNARARFIHLSPDAPAVDIAVKGGKTLFRNISFKEASDYIVSAPATVTLQVKPAGSQTVVLEVPGVRLNPNKSYTIIAVGFVEDTPGLEALLIREN